MQVTHNTEESWPGGPLRVVGSGNGKPSHYVCQNCHRQVAGVYRVKRGLAKAETWLCGTCREKAMPKQAQPEALRKHQTRL